MAFRRFRRRKRFRRSFKRGRFGRRRSIKGRLRFLAKRVRRINKYFERKYILISTSVTALLDTGFTLATPYQVVQGTNAGQRIGNKIHLKGITCRGFFYQPFPAMSGPDYFFVRIIALWFPKPNNAGTLVPAEYLEDSGSALARFNSPFSQTRPNIFKVIMDKKIVVNNGFFISSLVSLGGGRDKLTRIFKWRFKLNRTVMYDASTGLAQDITQGLFQLDFLPMHIQGGNNDNLSLQMTSLVTYIDA